MREWPLLGALIVLLDNDNFPSGLASLEDDSDLRDMVKCKTLRMPFRIDRSNLSGLVYYSR